MSDRLIKLLLGVLVSMTVGFAVYPYLFPTEYAKHTAKEEQPAVVKRDTKVDDWEREEDDEAWKEDETPVDDAPDERVARQDDNSFNEEDVPEDPKQKKIPESRVHAQFTSSLAAIQQMEAKYARVEKENFFNDDFPAERWNDPVAIYQEIADRVLAKLGNLDEKTILAFMTSPSDRLDLARLTIIRKIGTTGIGQLAAQPGGAEMLAAIMRDLNWCNGILYSGPTRNLGHGLVNLLTLYTEDKEAILKDEVIKKTATTCALEFAREDWPDEFMKQRYDFYSSSYKEGRLNALYKDLQYWDMRLVTGCAEGNNEGPCWGGARNLKWMRDNVRLPVDRYLGSEYQLQYRLRNVAGDSVFSGDYLGPVWEYTDHTIAWAHREIGGVCGALSHYASFGALSNGLPAMPMGEPGHCAYALRVNGEWRRGNSIYWQHGIQKTLWGQHEWDFLILMQNLYSQHFRTMISDQIIAMADFLGARKKMTASFNCYELALHAQPLNWPAHARYAGYLKLKAPNDYGKWKALHDSVVNGMGSKKYGHYCAAGKILAQSVYPGLVPLIKDANTRNKLFASFYKDIEGWGTNRWEVKELLDAQIAYCKDNKERKDFLHDVLHVLMAKKDYSGAVLTWGLGYVSKLPDEDGKTQEEFSNMMVRAMARSKTTKKELDATWASLGEAIAAAEENGERATFQAIGRLAYAKCKSKFEKKNIKAPRFPGKVISQTALIKPATTMGDGDMKNACQHWAVLQRFGGSIPGKFEGDKTGTLIQLDSKCDITGAVVVLKNPIEKDKLKPAFTLQASDDGQNWTTIVRESDYDGKLTLKFDARQAKASGKYLRIVRIGEKYEPGMTGVYVYGKQIKNR